jgi:RNA polymerase sigma-70 factor (ECF subfamily)
LSLNPDDRAWFEPLVRRTERSAFQYALMLVHNHAIAEEIVQEAFARVWASPRTPSDEPAFRRWLSRVLTNLARDHHRSRQSWAKLRFWATPQRDPLDEVERRAGPVAIALRNLSMRERHAIYLRYVEDRSFAETARMIGTREGNARLIVHRALGKLRRHLEPAMAAREVES